MSKNETVQFTNNIEKIMAELGTPSLKAFAGVFDLNPVRFYSVAKQPKEGVVYDAKVFNWDAIERFITRRLDAEKGLATLEDVVKAALVVEEELKQSPVMARRSRSTARWLPSVASPTSRWRMASWLLSRRTPRCMLSFCRRLPTPCFVR